MILSGYGNKEEFFAGDKQSRANKLPNLTKWYSLMAQHPACKVHADNFIQEMVKHNKLNISSSTFSGDEDTISLNRSGGKHVHFQKEKSVKFGEDLEIEWIE